MIKNLFFISFFLLCLSANAQSIATAVDAQTASKLEQGEWVKISQTKAMYRLDLGAGSSCDMPRNPSVFIENNKIIVLGNVRHHTMCVENYKLYPPIYIEMDIQKNPDYAKMPVIYIKFLK
jgi:hypothetical protein